MYVSMYMMGSVHISFEKGLICMQMSKNNRFSDYMPP